MSMRSDRPTPDFQLLFERLPGLFLALTPDLRIVAASDAYLKAIRITREEMLGRYLFAVFPDNTADPSATRVRNLRASLDRVLRLKEPDAIPAQRYDLPRPDGTFEERYWSPLNTPILDEQGNVQYILHQVEEVTRQVKLQADFDMAMQESQERLQLVVENTPDAIYVKDAEGRFLLVNSAAAALTGHVPDEVLGRSVEELYPPESARQMRAVDQTVMDTGRTVSLEETIRLPSGVEKVFLTTKYPYRSADGRVRGAMGISHDITDRKHGEEQQARYAAIVAFSPNAVLNVNPETDTVETWNKGAERLYGYTAAEILGKARSLLIPPELRAPYERSRDAVLRGERQEYLETVALRKDGARVDVRLSQFPVRDAQGRIRDIGVIASDITEQKRLLDALRESEDRYRRLVEVSPEAIMIDQDWKISYANPAAASLFAAPDPEAIVGRSLLDFMHPDDARSFAERIRQVRQEGKTSLLIEERIVRLDGTIATVETTVSPFTLKGQPGVLAIIRDITKRRRALEDAALKAVELKKVQELSRLKDHFLSTISHEMKTPLSLIMGYTEMLEEACPQQDIVMGIREGSRRLTEQIDKILDYSALVSGTLTLYQTELNLREIAEHVRAIMEERFRLKGVAFKLDVAPATPDIQGDFRRITQALLELLENALKFTPTGGQVGLRIAPTDAQVRIDVWDTGSGIPEDEFETIWAAFSQLAVGDAFRTGGLGLGLTIVKMLAELHGGKVAVVSQPGKGSTFSILLPAGIAPGSPGAHPGSAETGKT